MPKKIYLALTKGKINGRKKDCCYSITTCGLIHSDNSFIRILYLTINYSSNASVVICCSVKGKLPEKPFLVALGGLAWWDIYAIGD